MELYPKPTDRVPQFLVGTSYESKNCSMRIARGGGWLGTVRRSCSPLPFLGEFELGPRLTTCLLMLLWDFWSSSLFSLRQIRTWSREVLGSVLQAKWCQILQGQALHWQRVPTSCVGTGENSRGKLSLPYVRIVHLSLLSSLSQLWCTNQHLPMGDVVDVILWPFL